MIKRNCKICGLEKEIDQFESNKDCRYRRGYRCRKCLYQKKKYIHKAWLMKNKKRFNETHKIHQKNYARNNPEKIKAHNIANRNKDKIIQSNCELCGKTDRLHMHHKDYFKPLEILTVCVSCHERYHHA